LTAKIDIFLDSSKEKCKDLQLFILLLRQKDNTINEKEDEKIVFGSSDDHDNAAFLLNDEGTDQPNHSDCSRTSMRRSFW
jgi:hypothetical protein